MAGLLSMGRQLATWMLCGVKKHRGVCVKFETVVIRCEMEIMLVALLRGSFIECCMNLFSGHGAEIWCVFFYPVWGDFLLADFNYFRGKMTNEFELVWLARAVMVLASYA